jgi:5-methylcytosine-specific restriction endonuclease McrA
LPHPPNYGIIGFMKYDTPRLRAIAEGKTRYEGLPCKYGHGNTRYVANQDCVECRRLRKNEARKKTQKYGKRGRPKSTRTPEEIKESIRRASKKYWNKPENAGKRAAKRVRYKASKIQRTPKWVSQEETEKIKSLYEKAIQKTKETGIQWHVDHIIPLKGKIVSGLHVLNNLQIITAQDNLQKGNKLNSFRIEVI